jgi:hypothetical protein
LKEAWLRSGEVDICDTSVRLADVRRRVARGGGVRRLLALLLGGVILAAVAALAAMGASVAGDAAAIRITSSLNGRSSVPCRVTWTATPRGGSVSAIDFLIDGRLIWTERSAPYVFGGDDNGANRGYLITTWLTPGSHRFTARATTANGKTLSDTVTAKVGEPPLPPAPLRGFWTRIVTAKDLQKGDANGPPAGRWTLVFDRVGAWHLDPMGSGLANEYAVRGDVIHVYAPIQMGPFSNNGSGGVSKYGHHNIGGTDCTAAGPFGSYHWSVSGGKLVLKALREGCGNRRAIWEGAWTKR